MSVCMLADQLGRLGDVTGRRAELLDLRVDVVERDRRRALPVGDAERVELLEQIAGLVPSVATRSGS